MALAAVALTCTAAPALAQSGVDGYGPKNISPQVLGQTEGTGDNDVVPQKTVTPEPPTNPTTPVKKASGNELPFTGLDIGLVAVAGAALLGAGAGMRRLTRAPDAV